MLLTPAAGPVFLSPAFNPPPPRLLPLATHVICERSLETVKACWLKFEQDCTRLISNHGKGLLPTELNRLIFKPVIASFISIILMYIGEKMEKSISVIKKRHLQLAKPSNI